MKSKLMLLGFAVSLLGVVSCSQNKEAAMKNIAAEMVSYFISGEPQGVVGELAPSVKNNYPAGELDSLNRLIGSLMGSFVSAEEARIHQIKDFKVVEIPILYQNGGIDYCVVFDKKGAVVGFIPTPMNGPVVYEQDIQITGPAQVIDQLMSNPAVIARLLTDPGFVDQLIANPRMLSRLLSDPSTTAAIINDTTAMGKMMADSTAKKTMMNNPTVKASVTPAPSGQPAKGAKNKK